MLNGNLEPERLIARLRDTHADFAYIYLNGCCYQLFLLLRDIWPQAKPWYDFKAGHVYTEIEGRFYDIRGKYRTLPEGCERLDKNWPSHAPYRWTCPDRLKR